MRRLYYLFHTNFPCLWMFVPVLLCGCIILPLPSSAPEPFNDIAKNFAIEGQTTKSMVIDALGKPSTTRLGERIYVYAAGQENWKWVGGVFLPPIVFAGGTTTFKTNLLIFEFNKDETVTAVHSFRGDEGELKNGFYIVNSGGYETGDLKTKSSGGGGLFLGASANNAWAFRPRDFILRASKETDKQAKTYSAPCDHAVIYYYKNFSANLEVALDGKLSGDPGKKGFLMWIVEPGDHTVNCPWKMGRVTLSCLPGSKYYLKHEDENGRIKLESEKVGVQEIQKRDLIVERLNALDFD